MHIYRIMYNWFNLHWCPIHSFWNKAFTKQTDGRTNWKHLVSYIFNMRPTNSQCMMRIVCIFFHNPSVIGRGILVLPLSVRMFLRTPQIGFGNAISYFICLNHILHVLNLNTMLIATKHSWLASLLLFSSYAAL